MALIVGSCEAKCVDGWLSADKLTHAGCGAIAGSFYRGLKLPWWGALIGVGLVASMKEGADSQTDGNHWCWKDWTCTMLGGGFAIGMIEVAVHLDRRDREETARINFKIPL
jgi:hypothetical protein